MFPDPQMCSTFRILPHLLVSMAIACGMSGCDEDAIHGYIVPKDAPMPVQQPAAAAPAQDAAMWVKPPDWRVDPQGSQFAMASFLAGPDDPQGVVKITLTRFGGDGGGVIANLNRWRGQLGLPPVTSLDEQPHTPVTLHQTPAILVNLTGDNGQGMVGVLAFRKTDSWFVKATGPTAVLEEQVRPSLDAFIASIQLPQENSPQ